MRGMRKRTGRVMSMPAGIGIGVGVSGLATLIGAMVLAWLISAERMAEDSVGWGCMVIQMLASAVGCITAWQSIRHKRLMVIGLTMAGYYLALLVMALAFGGGFTGMGTTAVMIGLGGGIIQIPVLFGGGSGGHRHKKSRFR